MRTRIKVAATVTGLSLLVAACGGAAATTDQTTTTPAAEATTTTAAEAATTTTVPDAAAATVSANTASRSEIADALAAAGVSNADRWANEVVEYRPYDASDTDLTKLRANLAKYNPGPGVVDAIVAALTP